MELIKKDLFDTSASLYVLGSLMHKPLLLQDDRYAFTKTDFYSTLQQTLFYAIFNLAQQGVELITPQDIDRYLLQFEAQYSYYKKNKGFEYVNGCFENTKDEDEKQFQMYYLRLKKFSMLRDLESIGYNTSEFYDTTKNALNRDLEDEKLNRTKLKEIPDRIRQQLVEIENRHIGKDQGTSQEIFKGLEDLIQQYKDNPEVGLPLDGKLVNWTTRGARLGKLFLYSAPSGGGKTRFMVGNACAISMPFIDDNNQVVLRGEDGEDYQKVLFLATEMSVDEIQTLVLAYVSGVNEEKILLGNYTAEEEKRIKQAVEIMREYKGNFIVETIPDPSIAMIKARLIKYIVQDNIRYIFYDYIFTSPSLITEFSGADVKEYVALMMLSNTLKEVAMSYNVFVQSATQLNENWSKVVTGLRDQNCLRGSKAIADKADIGLIGVRLNEEERKKIDWNNINLTEQPNIVIDVYKNRRGKMNYVKIFRHFDFGTCRAKDLFVMSPDYKAYEVTGDLKYAIKYDSVDLFLKKIREKQNNEGDAND